MANAFPDSTAEAGMMDDYVSRDNPKLENASDSGQRSGLTNCTASSEQPQVINQHKEKQLVVDQESKVDAELRAKASEEQRPAVVWTVMKWVATLLIMLVVLGCIAANKITAISLSQNLGHYRLLNDSGKDPHPKGCSPHDENASSIFIMIVLSLMIPQAFTFAVAVWRGSFRSDRPWPSNKALAAGFLASLLEVAGLTLFALEVMSWTEPHISVILVNGVFLVPILSQFKVCCKGRVEVSAAKFFVVALALALLLEVAGLIVAFIYGDTYYRNKPNEAYKIWEIAVSLLCVSIAWSPWLQEMQVKPRKLSRSDARSVIRCRARSIIKSAGLQDDQPVEIQEEHAQDFVQEEASKDPTKSARWKQTILTSFWKLLLTPCFSLLFAYALNIYYIKKLDCGFKDLNTSHAMFIPFMINIFLTFSGYWLAIIGCAMCMQLATFAAPLILATPLTTTLVLVNETCHKLCHTCDCVKLENNIMDETPWFFVVLVCLYLAQLLSTGYFVLRSQTVVMHPESKLFWLPGYCGLLLEQLLLLGRKTKQTDEHNEEIINRVGRTRVYICTTMYRENEEEMEQLLRSLATINKAQLDSKTHFESHVFFDGAVRETKLTDFVLQLVALVERTLDVKTEECTKVLTPYGMRLSWRLPPNDKAMLFNIHLKDNFKVKNKKRWSQIMYMSYVIDWLMQEGEETGGDDETFILTTDADVRFSPDSVEALLDLMTRDKSVGAVCARTFPLGSGPIVWYQVFDYAIGHWFQKVANDVLGSVLCCPGCFSVYRIRALRDVVSTYASGVTRASEFLTKDMGEDRWLCTLMVQSGWRLEYCAVSEDSTHCPDEFEEFYKQRRRWIPSTLANQVLLLQQWETAVHFNDHIGYLFLLYQSVLLFSTLIGPATCMLVITGGLKYAYDWNEIGVMICLVAVCFMFTLICLYTKQENQLMAAKILTFLFALVMAAVAVGMATQIVEDIASQNYTETVTTTTPSAVSRAYGSMYLADPPSTTNPPVGHLSISTFYFAGIVGIFVVAGLLHINEIYCLFHGIWYWLCLPSGYLFLTIYSVCNITDRSWGTREEKSAKLLDDLTWQEKFIKFFWKIFFCCAKKNEEPLVEAIVEEIRPRRDSRASIPEEPEGERLSSVGSINQDDNNDMGLDAALQATFYSSNSLLSQALRAGDSTVPIRRWLRYRFKKYAPLFEDKGYDTCGLIHGMTNDELKEIGITKGADRRALLDDIKLLPPTDIETAVPDNFAKWLEEIGLEKYKVNFRNNHLTDKKGFERLKSMSIDDITTDLGVKKPGHLKRLLLAISHLRYPTEREIRIREAKCAINNAKLHDLRILNKEEFEYWKKLTESVLRPESQAFGQEDDLRDKLRELRNVTLVTFTVVNALWILILMSVSMKTSLTILGSNAVGVCSLFIFGLAMVIQLFCMMYHRLVTLMHRLARASFTGKGRINTSWSFHKRAPEIPDQDEETALRSRDMAQTMAKRRLTSEGSSSYASSSRSGNIDVVERAPLSASRSGTARRIYSSMSDRQPLMSNRSTHEHSVAI